MSPDILIIREGDGYRLLHGHLHLVSELRMSNAVFVEIKDEGKVRIAWTGGGFFVGEGNRKLPLRAN